MPPLSNWCDRTRCRPATSEARVLFPLCQLIFLNRNDNIHAWFLAFKGDDPMDFMVLKSRRKDAEDLDETPEPLNGTYRFLTATTGMSQQEEKTL